jgi:hypothetical protein
MTIFLGFVAACSVAYSRASLVAIVRALRCVPQFREP